MPAAEERLELVRTMQRLIRFAKNQHLYNDRTLGLIQSFVDGADFITKDKFESHPVILILEKVAKLEDEISRMLKQAQMNVEPQNDRVN